MRARASVRVCVKLRYIACTWEDASGARLSRLELFLDKKKKIIVNCKVVCGRRYCCFAPTLIFNQKFNLYLLRICLDLYFLTFI